MLEGYEKEVFSPTCSLWVRRFFHYWKNDGKIITALVVHASSLLRMTLDA